MTEPQVLYSIENRIAEVALNRPEKRNALNFQLVDELKKVLRRLEEDEEVKVIVLTGNGEAFCAGADLAYLETLRSNTFEENLADSQHLKELFSLIYHLRKVVIARVEGPAIAGGCGLATVCDVVFSVPEARFGFTEVNIGFIPAIVSIFSLRKMAESAARELLLSGRLIDAAEAKQLGLVNFIAGPEEIKKAVADYARKLVERTSASSLTLTKELIAAVQDLPLEKALDHAAGMNARARATDDCIRGITAFLNKEKIVW